MIYIQFLLSCFEFFMFYFVCLIYQIANPFAKIPCSKWVITYFKIIKIRLRFVLDQSLKLLIIKRLWCYLHQFPNKCIISQLIQNGIPRLWFLLCHHHCFQDIEYNRWWTRSHFNQLLNHLWFDIAQNKIHIFLLFIWISKTWKHLYFWYLIY